MGQLEGLNEEISVKLVIKVPDKASVALFILIIIIVTSIAGRSNHERAVMMWGFRLLPLKRVIRP